MTWKFALAVALLSSSAAGESCADSPAAWPRVVIGCWQLTERHDADSAVDLLQTYMRAGFTTFDTADIYGDSEALLGRLRARQPDGEHPEVFTKYVTGDASLDNARKVNSQSRQSLGGAPAMVQFHWWQYNDGRFVDAAQHLVKLQAEGHLRHVAACNFDTPHLKRLVDAGVPVVANQVQYSLLDRRPENGMVQYAREHGIKLAVFGTVAGGWLSDRWLGVKKKPTPRSPTVSFRMYATPLDRWTGGRWELFQELLRTLRVIADRLETTIANVAVLWVLEQLGPEGGWVILGIRDATHIDDHRMLLEGKARLHMDDMKAIEVVLAKGNPPLGDIWGHERGYV